MAELSISVPPALKQWIDERVALRHYSGATDYVMDLLRRDQEQATDETEWVREMINDGLASSHHKARTGL